jgi:uncharacterized membrane protein
LTSITICHNPPGVSNSRKLYWYANSGLFRCYTGCEEPTFDIYDLTRKVMSIQFHQEMDLNDAIRFIAHHFGFMGVIEDDSFENTSLDSIYLNKKEQKEDKEKLFKPA